MNRRRNSLIPYLSIALVLSVGVALGLAPWQKWKASKADSLAAVHTSDVGDGLQTSASAPRQAGIAFAKALQADDQAAVHTLAIGTNSQFDFIAGFSAWTAAYENYESAFAHTFSQGQKPFLENSRKMIAQMESADQKIDGDSATLAAKTNGSLILKFQKSQGAWKLELSSLCPDGETAAQIKKLHRLTAAYDDSRKNLQAGKVKTAEQAHAELKRRIDGVLLTGYQYESQGKPIGSPTTQPLPTTRLTTRPTNG
jgi:hypothetical protein